MRCLILIALCVAVASADYLGKNRFNKILNRYQNRFDTTGDLWGSDEVDDYVDDYVDVIGREKRCEFNQCPRDLEDFDDVYQTDRYDRTEWDDVDIRGRMSNFDDESGMGVGLLKEVEDANVKLASRLYKQCKDEKDDKNTIVSPLSIQLALAALNQGARGNTKLQIGRVIGGRLQKQERRQIFSTLVRQLKGLRQGDYSIRQQGTKINCVTGIFVSQTTRAQQMFIQLIKTSLGASLKHCSFHNQPQQCWSTINRWMAEKTQGKISHIVPKDAITDNTKMILINAMQLKANWGPQMRQHVTKEAKFYPLDSKKVKIVEVMETQGSFRYHEDELLKIVGIPTEQKELTFYVVVPKDKDGLTEVEKLHLQDGVQLKQLLDLADQKVRRVGVQLPKFQIKHKIDVRRTLRKQGVTDAFDPLRADFSGITGVGMYDQDTYDQYETVTPFRRNPFLTSEFDDETMTDNWRTGTQERKLHLNKFIHQSILKISESGITATTGTMDDVQYERTRYGTMGGQEWEGVDEMTGFNIREPLSQKMVKCNRAFAFVVKHNPTNQLLFVGRVIDAAQHKINDVYQTINVVDQF